MHPAFTSDHQPQGHAEPERMRRTLKEAGLWLTAWSRPAALIRALAAWVDSYNAHDLHSSLGDNTPRQLAREHPQRHSTPFVAA
jgi:hypothetical protein